MSLFPLVLCIHMNTTNKSARMWVLIAARVPVAKIVAGVGVNYLLL